MKHNKATLSRTALAALLALTICADAFSACSIGTGREDPTRSTNSTTTDVKPEYDLAVETGSDTEGGTGDVASSGDYVFNKDDWKVSEHEDRGIKYAQIQNTGWHGRPYEIDNVLFKVYENDADAISAYQGYYDRSKDFDKGHWEEGSNWFISDEWGVMDVSIVWMVYREGNILIITNLAMNGHWIVYGDDASDGKEPQESTYKGYILNNVPEIVRFVRGNFPEVF